MPVHPRDLMNALRGRDVVDARDREHDPRLDVAHEIEPKNRSPIVLGLSHRRSRFKDFKCRSRFKHAD